MVRPVADLGYGPQPHVRPLLVVVGTRHLVGGGVRIARAFDGDFGVLGSAVPPAVIVSQHGRIDDAVLAVNPLDRVGEGAEIGGGGAVMRTARAARTGPGAQYVKRE